MVKSFRDLQVWQKAMDLADAVYLATAEFPRDEVFGLRSQIRRAAVSIPSNIAEGRAIGGGRFLHHIRIAFVRRPSYKPKLSSPSAALTSLHTAHGLLWMMPPKCDECCTGCSTDSKPARHAAEPIADC